MALETSANSHRLMIRHELWLVNLVEALIAEGGVALGTVHGGWGLLAVVTRDLATIIISM